MKRFSIYMVALVLGIIVGYSQAHAFELKMTTLKSGSKIPVINVCTGSKGGGYERVGKALYSTLKNEFKVNVVNSKGSVENISGLKAARTGMGGVNGKPCHVAIIQEDSFKAFPDLESYAEPFDNVYAEPVILISTERFDSLDDFRGEGQICIQRGSGSEITGRAFGNLESNYKEISYHSERSWDKCLRALKRDKVQGILYVGDPTSKFMQHVDSRGKSIGLKVREIVDKDLNDDGTYETVEIRSKVFKNMLGWSNVDTMYTHSTIVIQTDVIEYLDSIGMLDTLEMKVGQVADTFYTYFKENSPLSF